MTASDDPKVTSLARKLIPPYGWLTAESVTTTWTVEEMVASRS